MLGSAGIKINPVGNLLIVGNVLFKIGDNGLQDKRDAGLRARLHVLGAPKGLLADRLDRPGPVAEREPERLLHRPHRLAVHRVLARRAHGRATAPST